MWGLEGPHDLLQGVPPMVRAGFQPQKAVHWSLPWSLLGFGLKTAWSSAQAGSQCTTYWSLLWSKLWQVVIKEVCHLPSSLNRDADKNNWSSVFEDFTS